ncbi:MAG: hypothetical protein Q8M98_06420 [Candidatus Cloacimonadaceae bacterium]|nr:hypothetical protein [Candidatus Cloacimonadaceae bacterium]
MAVPPIIQPNTGRIPNGFHQACLDNLLASSKSPLALALLASIHLNSTKTPTIEGMIVAVTIPKTISPIDSQ